MPLENYVFLQEKHTWSCNVSVVSRRWKIGNKEQELNIRKVLEIAARFNLLPDKIPMLETARLSSIPPSLKRALNLGL
jgi:hypothetical protein